MQVMTAKEAQTRFGQFSREAQRDPVMVTNHGQPVFLTIPVRINAKVAKLISELAPMTGEQAGQAMSRFFAELAAKQGNRPELSEDEINALIKSAND